MTNLRIIKLAPGALRVVAAEIPVMWWGDQGEACHGTLSEALDVQAQGTPALVLSAADVLLTSVSLSKKQARHMQKILPYLLEERLAVEPESQWYAVGKAVAGVFPVIALQAQPLRHLHQWLTERGIEIAGIAVDAQLLAHKAPAIISDLQQVMLLQPGGEALSLPADQFESFATAMELNTEPYQRLTLSECNSELASHWPQRIELLHSELRIEKPRASRLHQLPEVWRRTGIAAGVLLLLLWSMAWIQAWQYDRLEGRVSNQAVALYQSLFPGDRATARLSKQFRSRVAQFGGSGEGDAFVAMMAPVGAALAQQRDQGTQPKRLVYEQRDGVLVLDVEANSYEQLEKLKAVIEQGGLAVELANFRDQGERVAARIKVAQL